MTGLFRSVVTAAVLLTLAAGPLLADDLFADPSPGNSSRPVLISKSQAAFVHVLPQSAVAFGQPLPAHAVLHTSVASGKMKTLIASGPQPLPFDLREAFTAVPKGRYKEGRIVGVAADAERVYVLWWSAEAGFDLPPGGAQPPRPELGKGAYQLLVFDLSDGERLHALGLKEPPENPPEENVEAGSLKLTDKGVACHGTMFAFRGPRLVERREEKKRPEER